MQLRQEVFYYVAKLFKRDPQPVKGCGAARFHRRPVQPARFRPALKGKALKWFTARRNTGRALGQRSCPRFPLATIKYLKCLFDLLPECEFLLFEVREQG